METKLVSMCLVGVDCAFNGESNKSEAVCALRDQAILIPVCPEQLGGLTTPRDMARIVGGSGEDVLDGKARVVTYKGDDVSGQYLKGGEESLKLAHQYGVTEAILKALSPSCGCGEITTEDFDATCPGDGTTTALFKRNGINVLTELDIEGRE
jgi:uncharacterized protein YbbK (DUF523 family)